MPDGAKFELTCDCDGAAALVRRRDFRTSPWRNGGGITHEAIRRPPEPDAFAWRVSVAEIASSGPFSAFVGYRRHMVLLAGAGLNLDFEHGHTIALREPGDVAAFAGAPPPNCRLSRGPCLDLNLVTLDVQPVDVRILRGRAAAIQFEPGDVLLAFCLEGEASLTRPGAEPVVAGRHDLLILDVRTEGEVRIRERTGGLAAQGLFLAKLAHP